MEKIRRTYLKAVLRQEVSFFETEDASVSEIIHTISTDTSLIQQLLSEKVSNSDKVFLRWLSSVVLQV